MAGAIACVMMGSIEVPYFNGAILFMGICAVWVVLGYRSIKGSRLSAESPFLIASGRFEEAESHIDAALKSFSLFKTGKILSLHHLAVLRHAQKRWQESALLCRAILAQRLGALRGLSTPSMLLLADDLLHIGDLTGTHDALARLYLTRLNLAEALQLQQLQSEYLARIGAFEPMLEGMKTRIQLAELMPASAAARTQALLALAARKTGRNDLSQWLRRRAELLCEPAELISEQPILAELWPQAVPTDNGSGTVA